MMIDVVKGLVAPGMGLALGLVFTGDGCWEPKQVENGPTVVAVDEARGGRFTVQSHGTFKAGYDSNTREILIITDTVTGQEYLGVTGVGVSELRRETVGKGSTVRER